MPNLVTRSLTEAQIEKSMQVVVPASCMQGLKSQEEIDELKIRIHFAREASDTAGEALMSCAGHLSEIKNKVKGKGWSELCASGLLGMAGRQAEYLALVHERLLSKQPIPASCLVNVSITTLYLIAKETSDPIQKKMVAALVTAGGNGLTEKEVRQIRGRKQTVKSDAGPAPAYLKSFGATTKITKMDRAELVKVANAMFQKLQKLDPAFEEISAEEMEEYRKEEASWEDSKEKAAK